jgi:hypothetical protein
MTKRVEALKLSGGPSDGNACEPVTKWPIYLAADGTRMTTTMGDRVVNGRSATKGCYVLQRDVSTGRPSGYSWTELPAL